MIKVFDCDIMVIGRKVGVFVCLIKNKMIKEYICLEEENVDCDMLEELILGFLWKVV